MNTTLSDRAQAPRTQVTAMTAMLTALLALTWALTHHLPADDVLRAGAAGYGALVAAAVLWLRVDPLAVLLSTVRIAAALVVALVRAAGHRGRARRETWA